MNFILFLTSASFLSFSSSASLRKYWKVWPHKEETSWSQFYYEVVHSIVKGVMMSSGIISIWPWILTSFLYFERFNMGAATFLLLSKSILKINLQVHWLTIKKWCSSTEHTWLHWNYQVQDCDRRMVCQKHTFGKNDW